MAFEMVDTAVQYPGVCDLCNGSKGPFVDTKMTDGISECYKYICLGCAEEIANTIGCSGKTKTKQMTAKMAGMKRQIESLKKKFARYETVKDKMDEYVDEVKQMEAERIAEKKAKTEEKAKEKVA